MVKGFALAGLLFMAFVSLSALDEGTYQEKDRNRFSFSWSAGMDGHPNVFSRTSILGLGIVLYEDRGISVWNQIGFCNGVMIMEEVGIWNYKKALFEKVSIGIQREDSPFRPYGFVEGRIGTCGTELWDFQDNPLIGNAGVGAGMNIFATEHWSFFQELGFLGNFYRGEFIPQQRFELGTMVHF